MPTIIYSAETRKPTPAPAAEAKGVTTYAHDPATGTVKATQK